MKHLKSSSNDLRKLFESISVRYIAEALISFDEGAGSQVVSVFMGEPNNYDVVGVRHDGLVVGYVKRADLSDGTLANYLVKFNPDDIVDESTQLVDVLKRLRKTTRLFVLILGRIGGIVTRGDIQKVPLRMWLFGLVSMIEMQLLRIIRNRCPNDRWKTFLTRPRLEKAQELLSDRRKRSEEIDLADCLQFCDKREVIIKGNMLKIEGFDLLGRLKEIEHLRDKLAHAQDIVAGNWPKIVDIAEDSERLLIKLEKI